MIATADDYKKKVFKRLVRRWFNSYSIGVIGIFISRISDSSVS